MPHGKPGHGKGGDGGGVVTGTGGGTAGAAGGGMASGNAGTCGDGSAQAPRPIAPLAATVVTSQRPLFRWAAGAGSDATRVQICGDRACGSVTETIDVAGTSATPEATLPAGAAFWRVTSLRAGQLASAPSATWEIWVGHRSAPITSSWGDRFDADGDGFADALAGNTYLRGGSAGLTVVGPLPGITTIDDPFSAGDVNGDGFSDVTRVLAGDATGQFPWSMTIFFGGPTPFVTTQSVTDAPQAGGQSNQFNPVGDGNGDGYGDLLIKFRFGAHMFYGGAAGVTRGITPEIPGQGRFSAYGGDFNNDGFGDGLFGQIGVPQIALAPGSADGFATPAPGFELPAGLSPTPAMLADLTGDGHADAAISMPAMVALHASTGTTLDSTSFLTLTVPGQDGTLGAEEIADFNGDGLLDIVVATRVESDSAWLFSGVAPGCAAITPQPLPFSGTFTVRAGDVNHDGFDDLIVALPGQVLVFFGGPSGLAATPDQTIAVP